MDNIVLDTNCLLPSLKRDSIYYPIWSNFIKGAYCLCVTDDILNEYEEIIAHDCAIKANAKYIVTEDHHFDILQQIDFPKVDIIGIDEFVESLQNFEAK